MNSTDPKSAKARQSNMRTAAAPSADTPAKVSAKPLPSDDAVARRAYERWEQSGGTHGDDQRHWYEAERDLRR